MDSEVQAQNKKCTKCNKLQPISFFYIRSDTNKYSSHCKECRSKRHKERYKTDSDYRLRLKKTSEAWQKENPLLSRFQKNRANALNKSRRREISFDLTFEKVIEMWNLGCEYCGKDVLLESGIGLDRKDSDGDYSISNVVPCCGDCNKVKNTILTYEEMKVAMSAVLKLRKSNKIK